MLGLLWGTQMMAPNRKIAGRSPGFWAAVAVLAAALVLAGAPAQAKSPAGPQRFASPQQAVTALVAAVRDGHEAALLAVLGPGAEDVVNSGDPVADRNGRARFLKAYARKNGLKQENSDRTVLLVGSKDYPFPIPIVRQKQGWVFDTAAGREEILDRRIGRNELQTIAVMQAYTEAQRQFACTRHNGSCSAFAQKFTSSPGERDGLYWAAAAGEPESPFGPLLARAAAQGYADGLGREAPEPFHGYLFKILKAQGPHAEGGAFSYVANGQMILGFALVAYPARYGASGIMTFIVNQEGVIYEQDLGPDTAAVAAAMTAYDPGPGWRRYQEPAAAPGR